MDVDSPLISLNKSLEFDTIMQEWKAATLAECKAKVDTVGERKQLFIYRLSDSADLLSIVTNYADFLTVNLDGLVNDELKGSGQAKTVSRQQIELVIASLEAPPDSLTRLSRKDALQMHSADWLWSQFELFAQLYVALRQGHDYLIISLEGTQQYLISYLDELLTEKATPAGFCRESRPRLSEIHSFCTQIIFDSGDWRSAFEQLDRAFDDMTSPFRIRSCWIQSTLKAEFDKRFTAQGFSDNEEITFIKANFDHLATSSVKLGRGLLIGGLPRKVLNSNFVVLVNFFRTTRDLLEQLESRPNYGRSASIWTENLSLSHELTDRLTFSNIWLNSNGQLVTNVPLTFLTATTQDGRNFGENVTKMYGKVGENVLQLLKTDCAGYIRPTNLNYRFTVMLQNDAATKQFKTIGCPFGHVAF